MEENLECPICLVTIHPSNLKPYGLCPSGHMICGECTKTMIASTGRGTCPQCRKKGLVLESHNVLANFRLDHLLSMKRYPCQFCAADMQGTELLDHEGQCEFRKFKCPQCDQSCTHLEFTVLSHPCITKAIFPLKDYIWHFLITFDELKSVKDGLHISPIMLLSSKNGPESRAYVDFFRKDDSKLGIKVVWMDNKQFVNPAVSELKVQVFAKVFTEAKYLQDAYSSPFYFNPHVSTGREMTNLDIPFDKLDYWQRYALDYTCKDCGLVGTAQEHVHFIVKFLKEYDIQPVYVWRK